MIDPRIVCRHRETKINFADLFPLDRQSRYLKTDSHSLKIPRQCPVQICPCSYALHGLPNNVHAAS